jgi:peptidoglycan glycosyltransferase
MPEDFNHRRPEDDEPDDQPENGLERLPDDGRGSFADDSDLPFRLPLSGDAGSIHKEDTEDIAALHAADPPLERGLPEDESMLHRANGGEDDDMAPTVPYPRQGEPTADVDDVQTGDVPRYDYDSDVPFNLPQSGDATDPRVPVGSLFVTMPSTPPRPDDPTLPGTEGLDPNPDFNKRAGGQQTIQRMPNVPSVTMPAPSRAPAAHQTVQRPMPPVQRPAQTAMPTYPAQPGVTPAPPAGAYGPAQARPLPKRRRKRMPMGCAIALGLFVTVCMGTTLLSFIGGVIAYAQIGNLLNDRVAALDDYANFQSTYLYDRNGVELYEVFGEGRRRNVPLEQIPQHLINATIAIEDGSFYSNIGIDIPATTVAFLVYIGAESGERTPGGSTITQQLVRNVLFDFEYRSEVSVQRKAEEILLAIALTQRRSKDDILELYLNEIYYGNLAYGAAAAAEVFFNKDVSELTLGEAALLAGLPQAPADLDPLDPSPEVQADVLVRWEAVLNEMVEEGFITRAEYDAALNEGLTFDPQDVPLEAPHFVFFARTELERLMAELGYSPEEIARGGLQVYTSVDTRINEDIRQIAAEQVAAVASQNVSNAAVVVLTPITGEVLAMVGSIDYNNEAIDGEVNVTTRLRQPGSAMKPFTYAAYLELGGTPGDIMWDTPIVVPLPGQTPPTYQPGNYEGGFYGPIRMRDALANSRNITAVNTLRQIGVQYLLDYMARLGAESLGTDASRFGPSLTLGGGEISPLELTRAYSVLANQGLYVPTHAIRCILDNEDIILYEYEGGCEGRGDYVENTVVEYATDRATPAVDPRVAFVISDILGDNGARSRAFGTNSDLFTPNIASSVKTGTTDLYRDNWTVGYTANVAIGVWVGNNNGDSMVRSTGLTGAGPIWNQSINLIYNNPDYLAEFAYNGQLLTDQLSAPEGITPRSICSINGLREPQPGCNGTVSEWFLDYPAALPDGVGGLYYPDQGQFQPGYPELLDGGVYRAVAYRLAPGTQINFPIEPGQTPPPNPLFCIVPVELIPSAAGAQELLFLQPPPVADDAARAESWARAAGYNSFLPTISCSQELLTGGGGFGAPVVTAVINSPAPGQAIDFSGGLVPILGTANFTPEQAAYYKLEIIGGAFAGWTTIGPTYTTPVVNGQLDTLPVLEPGSYSLRLVIVGLDGNHLQQPYEVPFTVP